MAESRKHKGRGDTRVMSDKARALEARALAHGKKPFTTVKEWAGGTPKDADELLAAIRSLREEDNA